jgi:pyrroline-5-carboxylate reductase
MTKIGFIGAGNMGSALAKATSLAENTELFIYDKDGSRAEAIAEKAGARATDISYIAKSCDFIFLAVKPNIISPVIEEIAPTLANRDGYTVVSMAAGVSISKMEGAFGDTKAPIIRIMPNTPVGIGKGMTLWCKNELVCEGAALEFVRIMERSGAVDSIPERLIDAASAISGCGPAFVYMFIEALADGGVECGLPRDKALAYACETVIGAAETVKKSGEHPEKLKDAVCSPGGSTIAGVHALEEGAFRAASANAVVSAYKKTLTLGK